MNQLTKNIELQCCECNAYGPVDDFNEYADVVYKDNYCYECWVNIKNEYPGAFDDELFYILEQGSCINRLKAYRLYLTTVIKEHYDDEGYEYMCKETDEKIMNETKRLEMIENKRKEYLK
jgi:hypothetical protein